MVESYFELRPNEMVEMLEYASMEAGRQDIFLEKDIWSVWSLQKLFNERFGDFLAFKGGTSLSKAYGLIQRFSEDVDIAFDIRQLRPRLKTSGYDHLPTTSSQGNTLGKAVRKPLQRWMENEAVPLLASGLAAVDPKGRIEKKSNAIYVHYTPRTEPIDYISHAVKLEFYPRSTGEPCKPMPIACDIADHISGVEFPAASPRVMAAERTFWEKACAMHVMCKKANEPRKHRRFARHLYDLVCLAKAGVAASAVADRGLAFAVAEHNDRFRKEKYGSNKEHIVDYHEIYSGKLQLVPDNEIAMQQIYLDYQRMIDTSMFIGTPLPFALIVDECRQLEFMVNNWSAT